MTESELITMKETGQVIHDIAENGLKYKYLQFTLSEYRAIEEIFQRIIKNGSADCFMDNVVSFYALQGFITVKSYSGINWYIGLRGPGK